MDFISGRVSPDFPSVEGEEVSSGEGDDGLVGWSEEAEALSELSVTIFFFGESPAEDIRLFLESVLVGSTVAEEFLLFTSEED